MTEIEAQCSHNLLTDPLIRVQREDGSSEYLTLPGVLAMLSAGKKYMAFPGLQAHQWPSWYTFLVQLSALSGAGASPPTSEGAWLEQLRGLTSRFTRDEPWCLSVTDLTRPAFMQPPVPENTLERFKGPHPSPDSSDIDVLFTSDHHELKMDRLTGAYPEHWIYGLIAYQTFSGYAGKGNYGIIKMNSGTATRVIVGLTPERRWSSSYLRDLAVLQSRHTGLAAKYGLPESGGHSLLWIPPWNGKESIPWADCDPYAIEISRRVRLWEQSGKLLAYHCASEAPRLSPKSDVLKGNVGDPWIPISDEGTAVNVGSAGWNYKRTRQIILGDGYSWSPCQQPQDHDPEELWFYAVALARGQGKTEGFHERWIHIPRRIRSRLFDASSRQELSRTAKERVDQAGQVRRALHNALVVLLAGAPDHRPDFRDQSDQRWLRRFDARVDSEFFPRLWDDADLDKHEHRKRWDHFLRRLAEEEILPQAEREAPIADARKERARAVAWMSLRGQLNRILTDARE